MSYTKGPWRRDKYGSLVDSSGEQVMLRGTATLCSGSDARMAEAEANSDLIAAAPELFEALEMASQSAGFQYMTPETRDAISAALSKARGESNG